MARGKSLSTPDTRWPQLCKSVYFYVAPLEEEEIHEKAKQEDIEEMAQSEEMRKHKLLYNNKFIHNLSQHSEQVKILIVFLCV
jgi:hypothetical protein